MSETTKNQNVGSSAAQKMKVLLKFDAVTWESTGVRAIFKDNSVWDGNESSFDWDDAKGYPALVSPNGGRKVHKHREANDGRPTCTLDGVGGSIRYWFRGDAAPPQARKVVSQILKLDRVIESDEVFPMFKRDDMIEVITILDRYWYPGLMEKRTWQEWFRCGFFSNPEFKVEEKTPAKAEKKEEIPF